MSIAGVFCLVTAGSYTRAHFRLFGADTRSRGYRVYLALWRATAIGFILLGLAIDFGLVG